MQARQVGTDEGLAAALGARIGPLTLERQRARPRGGARAALAEDGGAYHGHALLAHERRRLGDASLDVASVELVAATAAAREPLLAGAVELAAEASLPFLVLRASPAAFAPFGLAPCSLRSRVALPPSSGDAALRLAGPQDLDDLAALADTVDAVTPLGPARAAPDWRWTLAAPEGWLVYEDGRGRVAGYGAVAGDVVYEAAAADAGAARALIAGLAAAGAVALHLPLDHGVARAALLAGGVAEVRPAQGGEEHELWGVVDLAAALGAVAPAMLRRLGRSRYAGWEGAVRLRGPAGSATARAGGGVVVVEAGPGPADVTVSELGLAAAAQLLLGYRAAGDLRATGELRCADVDLGLLDILFGRDADRER